MSKLQQKLWVWTTATHEGGGLFVVTGHVKQIQNNTKMIMNTTQQHTTVMLRRMEGMQLCSTSLCSQQTLGLPWDLFVCLPNTVWSEEKGEFTCKSFFPCKQIMAGSSLRTWGARRCELLIKQCSNCCCSMHDDSCSKINRSDTKGQISSVDLGVLSRLVVECHILQRHQMSHAIHTSQATLHTAEPCRNMSSSSRSTSSSSSRGVDDAAGVWRR